MIFPCLVPKHLCKTDCSIVIYGDIDEDGKRTELLKSDLKCNYQDKAKRVIKTNNGVREEVQVVGTALFTGDIAPEIVTISAGTIEIFGEVHQIALGCKSRNPDGTVNYTRIEVI